MNPNTQNNTEFIEQDIVSLKKTIDKLSKEIDDLKFKLTNHNHDGRDGSSVLNNSIKLAPTEMIHVGNMRLEEITDESTNTQYGFIVVGKDKEDTVSSDNTQLALENQAFTNDSNNYSFFYGNRYPLFKGAEGSVTSGSSTFTTKEFNFRPSQLVGAQLIVYNSTLSTFDSKTITSNNNTTITVKGTFSITNSKAQWFIMMPVFLGAAEYPWRQVYAGGENISGDGTIRRAIRLGYGPTSSAAGIYFGTGVPTFSAPNGSLFLRTDGTSSAALYIRAGGAWSAR